MKTNALMVAGALSLLAFVVPVSGGSLPMLEEKPWVGYFIGYESRSFHFGIDLDAGMRFMPVGKNGEAATHRTVMSMAFVVEELKPGGRIWWHAIDTESLTSETEATDDPDEEVKILGKTKSGIGFELSAEFDRSKAIFGGKVTNAGGITNPLRVAVKARFPNIYWNEDAEDKAFQKKVRKDKVEVKTLDGEREKFAAIEAVEAGKVNGKGLSLVEVEFAGYNEKSFEFEVEGAGALELDYKGSRPLLDGFALYFRPDPAKDKEGRARMTLTFR